MDIHYNLKINSYEMLCWQGFHKNRKNESIKTIYSSQFIKHELHSKMMPFCYWLIHSRL